MTQAETRTEEEAATKMADHLFDHIMGELEDCTAWQKMDCWTAAEMIMTASCKIAYLTLVESDTSPSETRDFLHELFDRLKQAVDVANHGGTN